MKNFNLFGGETEISAIPNTALQSKYQKFKTRNHYRKADGNKKCGNCKSHIRGEYHNNIYHKCKRLGISNSHATDIRVNNVCDLYEGIN